MINGTILLLLLLLFSFPTTAQPKSYTWLSDDITISNSSISYFYNISNPTFGPLISTITIESNDVIYDGDGGHFRIEFFIVIVGVGEGFGQSTCITLGSSQKVVANTIASTLLNMTISNDANIYTRMYPFSDFADVNVKKYFNSTSLKTTYRFTYSSTYKIGSFLAWSSLSGCFSPRTIGSWSNPKRWSNGSVPSTGDTAIIPAGSGVIALDSNVSLANLIMEGGMLLSYSTSCPPGWKFNSLDSSPNKCYRMSNYSSTFAEADESCSESGQTSKIDGHLVEIRSYSELELVKRLCRNSAL
jgi:hypothetical protein